MSDWEMPEGLRDMEIRGLPVSGGGRELSLASPSSVASMALEAWGCGVSRWHASGVPALRLSGDTTDAHGARMGRLALALLVRLPAFDPRGVRSSRRLLALLRACLLHDAGEVLTGDAPSAAAAVHGRLGWMLCGGGRVSELIGRAASAAAEVGRLVADVLSPGFYGDDAVVTEALGFLDLLDAWLWACRCAPWVVGADEWRSARDSVLGRAAGLLSRCGGASGASGASVDEGFMAAVRELLDGAELTSGVGAGSGAE